MSYVADCSVIIRLLASRPGDDLLRQRLARTIHAPALLDAEVSSVVRGLAITGSPPQRLLGWLNDLVHHVDPEHTASVMAGYFDPRSRTLTWAQAGHPPPLLVRGEDGEQVHAAGLVDAKLLSIFYPRSGAGPGKIPRRCPNCCSCTSRGPIPTKRQRNRQ